MQRLVTCQGSETCRMHVHDILYTCETGLMYRNGCVIGPGEMDGLMEIGTLQGAEVVQYSAHSHNLGSRCQCKRGLVVHGAKRLNACCELRPTYWCCYIPSPNAS
jgi:hypothetical protein